MKPCVVASAKQGRPQPLTTVPRKQRERGSGSGCSAKRSSARFPLEFPFAREAVARPEPPVTTKDSRERERES